MTVKLVGLFSTLRPCSTRSIKEIVFVEQAGEFTYAVGKDS